MNNLKAANSNYICPICKEKAALDKFHPFCSARCADIDLGRWLKGNYTIPGEKADISNTDEEDNN